MHIFRVHAIGKWKKYVYFKLNTESFYLNPDILKKIMTFNQTIKMNQMKNGMMISKKLSALRLAFNILNMQVIYCNTQYQLSTANLLNVIRNFLFFITIMNKTESRIYHGVFLYLFLMPWDKQIRIWNSDEYLVHRKS